MDEYKIIDFHSHILPDVDHGSESLETSMKQVLFAIKSGVSHIVATSHFYPDKHDVDFYMQAREEAYESLLNAIKAKGLDIDIRLGAEVLLWPGIENLPRLSELCIKGTNCLLIELPFADFKSEYLTTVENLIESGYRVVLAHVDRYPYRFIEEMIAIGAELQVNASALTCLIKPPRISEWINRGYVVALGSDIHMLDSSAYKKLAKCKKRLKGSFEKIMEKSYNIITS